jgi:hypothetical protein
MHTAVTAPLPRQSPRSCCTAHDMRKQPPVTTWHLPSVWHTTATQTPNPAAQAQEAHNQSNCHPTNPRFSAPLHKRHLQTEYPQEHSADPTHCSHPRHSIKRPGLIHQAATATRHMSFAPPALPSTAQQQPQQTNPTSLTRCIKPQPSMHFHACFAMSSSRCAKAQPSKHRAAKKEQCASQETRGSVRA